MPTPAESLAAIDAELLLVTARLKLQAATLCAQALDRLSLTMQASDRPETSRRAAVAILNISGAPTTPPKPGRAPALASPPTALGLSAALEHVHLRRRLRPPQCRAISDALTSSFADPFALYRTLYALLGPAQRELFSRALNNLPLPPIQPRRHRPQATLTSTPKVVPVPSPAVRNPQKIAEGPDPLKAASVVCRRTLQFMSTTLQ